jgi:peptidoglycan hydrolase CwlO-like protein
MNPALAGSCVVAIFVAFLVLYAAIGTSTNSDEIGSLRWDLEYDVRTEIDSLQSEIESLSQDVEYDLQTEMGALQYDVESLRREVEYDVQAKVDALQSELESLTQDLEYIRLTIDR